MKTEELKDAFELLTHYREMLKIVIDLADNGNDDAKKYYEERTLKLEAYIEKEIEKKYSLSLTRKS